MKRKVNIILSIDWITVILYLLLVFLGWITIYAAVYNEEYQNILDFSQRYGKQLIWIIAALLLVPVIFILDSKFYSFFAYPIYGITILLLILVLFVGKEFHGSRSWFNFGYLLFQPSEFAKVATCLAIAYYLSSYDIEIHKLKTLINIAVILFLPALLIFLQNDAGSAIVYFVFILVLYREGLSAGILLLGFFVVLFFFFALLLEKLVIILLLVGIAFLVFWFLNRKFKPTVIAFTILGGIAAIIWGANVIFKFNIPIYYIILLSLIISGPFYTYLVYKYKIQNFYLTFMFLAGSIIFAYSVDYVFNNVLEKHQQQRINVLLGFESDPLGYGYNVNQSKIAIGSGGLTGKGFLQGTQTKFDFVPKQSTDFIFCTIGEEWGFVGTSIVILLFLALFLRIIYLAERQRSVFSRIYGYGVVSILLFHFTINIGMTINLLPVIGIPLPFFSYGGSSLWAFTILLFILIRLDASRLEF